MRKAISARSLVKMGNLLCLHLVMGQLLPVNWKQKILFSRELFVFPLIRTDRWCMKELHIFDDGCFRSAWFQISWENSAFYCSLKGFISSPRWPSYAYRNSDRCLNNPLCVSVDTKSLVNSWYYRAGKHYQTEPKHSCPRTLRLHLYCTKRLLNSRYVVVYYFNYCHIKILHRGLVWCLLKLFSLEH